MKKLVLSALFASSMLVVSCNKKEPVVEEQTTTETTTTTDPVTETETTTTTTETTLEVPKFSSPELQKYAEEYTAYAKEQMDAVKSGDAAKIAKLQEKAAEWAKKGQEAMAKVTPEDMKLWADYNTKLGENLQAATEIK